MPREAVKAAIFYKYSVLVRLSDWVSFCMFVQINVKMNLSDPIFVWDLYSVNYTRGSFWFVILKMREKIFWNPPIFFVYITQREDAHVEKSHNKMLK